MKFFQQLSIGALASFSTLYWVSTTAAPAGGLSSSLVKRGYIDAGIIKELLNVIGVATSDDTEAWETDKLPQMCQVRMSTYEGGGCKASVTCSDGVKREYNDWNVCYVGGRQFFTDPAIGDFSITWTDGGRGLGSPILQVKSVKDWSEWDVSSLSSDYIKEKDYNARPETNLCYRVNAYDSHFNYDYICGVPKVGSKGAGIQADKPVNDRGYAPGWCGMHVVQHQKPNPATDRYRFDITLKDHNGKAIGEVLGAVADKPIEVFSKLPYVFILTGGNVDSDAVLFDYAGQHWGSNDQGHHCDFGAYDNGARQGDCGFSCD